VRVLCTTAVDWIKVKLATSVIATAAVPHASAFKPLFTKVFMVVLASPVSALCTMQLAVVMVLYITTSLHECQASSLNIFWGTAAG
jgi:hypothetical protein